MMDQGHFEGAAARMDGAALLAKACDVLEAVSAQRDGIGQAELSARLGLPRTTLYRILAGLVARGLLRQDPARRVYSLGLRARMSAAPPPGWGTASPCIAPARARPSSPSCRRPSGRPCCAACRCAR
jgi:IclR family acetate operon transcriptional repressor